MEALALHHEQHIQLAQSGETIQERLRKQMQADALSASPERDDGEDEDGESSIGMSAAISGKDKKKLVELNQQYDPDFLEEAVQFLRLQVRFDPFVGVCVFWAENRFAAARSLASSAVLSQDNVRVLFLLRD